MSSIGRVTRRSVLVGTVLFLRIASVVPINNHVSFLQDCIISKLAPSKLIKSTVCRPLQINFTNMTLSTSKYLPREYNLDLFLPTNALKLFAEDDFEEALFHHLVIVKQNIEMKLKDWNSSGISVSDRWVHVLKEVTTEDVRCAEVSRVAEMDLRLSGTMALAERVFFFFLL